MSDDLISRKRVLDEFEEMNAISFYTLQEDSREAYYELRQVVEQTPSADHSGDLTEMVRPKGKWIRDRYWSRGAGMGEEYGFFYKCSMCEYEVENGYTRCRLNYCPYCGAKMKGADDD